MDAPLKTTDEAEFGALVPEGLALPELLALLALLLGSPNPVMLPENGPGTTVATAPTPDKAPTACEGTPENDMAFDLKDWNVWLPEAGAFIAPTIPLAQ